jgi:hypothetical protein
MVRYPHSRAGKETKLCEENHSQLPRSGIVQQAAAADAGRVAVRKAGRGGKRPARLSTSVRREKPELVIALA